MYGVDAAVHMRVMGSFVRHIRNLESKIFGKFLILRLRRVRDVRADCV